jgi:hypothetical protein
LNRAVTRCCITKLEYNLREQTIVWIKIEGRNSGTEAIMTVYQVIISFKILAQPFLKQKSAKP